MQGVNLKTPKIWIDNFDLDVESNFLIFLEKNVRSQVVYKKVTLDVFGKPSGLHIIEEVQVVYFGSDVNSIFFKSAVPTEIFTKSVLNIYKVAKIRFMLTFLPNISVYSKINKMEVDVFNFSWNLSL